MSNKTPTPIQQAIEEILLLKISASHTIGTYAHNLAIDMAIEKLQHKLPAERKFAEECFDAGKELGIDEQQITETKPDFSTFYKNNCEDGK